MTETPELCHCGQPLHYPSPEMEAWVNKLIREHGPNEPVLGADGRVWSVPRHYLALHGVTAEELPHLGFEELS